MKRSPILLLLLVPTLAQTTASQPALDLSSPRATLLTLYTAMRNGDVARVESCMVFDDAQQQQVVDITLTQLITPLKLMHAMEDRFGPPGRAPFASATLDKSLSQLIIQIKTIPIDSAGNSATVAEKKLAIDPNAETELSGITLKKQADQWKVLASTISDLAGDMPPTQLRMMRAMRDAQVEACDHTLQRLAHGDFKTADEAFTAYQQRLQQNDRTAAGSGRSGAGSATKP